MSWRNNKEGRKGTPNKQVIWRHWHPFDGTRILPIIRGNDLQSSELNTCFACGHFANIERCHIIPLIDGGSNTVENLHLLCRSCHSVSEGNPNYWQWLSYMRDKEWMSRPDWIRKVIEMNGVDMNAWIKKHEPLRLTKAWFKAYILLQLENGIECTPKPHCEDDWRELIEEANREYEARAI